jgi:hypothetical protein
MRLRSGETLEGMASMDGKAERRAEHGEGDAGVAAGGVEQSFAGNEQAAGARVGTMEAAARSLTLPPGLAHSALASSASG